MNTPIIKISDDQNEITHESGAVTVFEEVKEGYRGFCIGCYYDIEKNICGLSCETAICFSKYRKDDLNGIFKLKQP